MKSLEATNGFSAPVSATLLATGQVASSERTVNRHSRTDAGLSDEAIAIAERLLLRLPKEGGIVLVGSLGAKGENLLAQQLALAFQVISSKRALFLEFSVPREAGGSQAKARLLEVLAGESHFEQVVEQAKGVAVMQYGQPGQHRSELVVSNQFRAFLESASREFPWIVLSCGSFFDFEETASLVSRADGVVAGVKRGVATVENLHALQGLCRELKTEFLGVVLI